MQIPCKYFKYLLPHVTETTHTLLTLLNLVLYKRWSICSVLQVAGKLKEVVLTVVYFVLLILPPNLKM